MEKSHLILEDWLKIDGHYGVLGAKYEREVVAISLKANCSLLGGLQRLFT